MRQIEIDELKKLQLDILKKVDSFCRSNNIKYTLFYGTLIGVVRHKGYIPWDDDIDIAMTRPNYEKFLQSFNGIYNELEVFAPELDWNYYAPFANVCDNRTVLLEGENGHHGMEIGVKIDIFPIDGVSPDIDEYYNIKRKIAKLWAVLFNKRVVLREVWRKNKTACVKSILRKILLLKTNYAKAQKSIRKLVTSYSFENSEYVENLTFPLSYDARCCKKAFEEYIDMPFENITVSIIKGYDEYLTKIYGDYMQLPPVEQQIPQHGFTAYWKE